MKYLCRHHQTSMQQNEPAAAQLWHAAIAHGKEAFERGNWRLAQSFFGSAFEIAIIRLHQNTGSTELFNSQHLTDAARLLTNTLCYVDQFDEAEDVLLYCHNYLLETLASTTRTYDEQKYLLRLTQEFLKRATTLLRIRGKSSHADSVTLISSKATSRFRETLLH